MPAIAPISIDPTIVDPFIAIRHPNPLVTTAKWNKTTIRTEPIDRRDEGRVTKKA
jgi:hypothetical protein